MAYPRTQNLFDSYFCGFVMRQYWADVVLWELFLNSHKDVKTIVELGAFHGGFTLFLKTQAVARSLNFYSFDRDYPVALDSPLANALDLHNDFHLGDFWTTSYDKLIYSLTNATLKPLILFVDGRNKFDEFTKLVPHLSSGDYVSVHDYGTEFKPGSEDIHLELLEREFWDECLAPPQPSLTRFWKVK